MLSSSLLFNAWLLLLCITFGKDINKSDAYKAQWTQYLSVGLLVNGHTMSENLTKVYSTTGKRMENWIKWGMDSKGFDIPATAKASIKNEETGTDDIVDVFMNYDITTYDVEHGVLPEKPDSHDVYVLSGSASCSVDEEPWMLQLEEFIRKVDQIATNPENHERSSPIMIGICFGHQIIHKALGGQVVSGALAYPLIGNEVYDIYTEHPMMRYESKKENQNNKISLDVLHDDQVVALADGFTAYAGNASNPFGITIKGNHILTFQAHPEYPNKNNLRYIRSIVDDIYASDNMDKDSYQKLTKMISYAPNPETARASLWTSQFISDAMGFFGITTGVKAPSLEDDSIPVAGTNMVDVMTAYAKKLKESILSF